jgi:hypothetical protein
MRSLLIAAMLLSTGACSKPFACYALSDEDAASKVIAEYAKEPAATRGDTAQMQLSPTRVTAIGRSPGAKGDGKAITQVWFTQDDHTVTVATLTERCELQFRPNLTPEAMKQAAIPIHAPNF